MVATDDSIMASYNRIMNYEPAENRMEFTFNAMIAFKIEALNPKKNSKEYLEMMRRRLIVEEYIDRTGDNTCEWASDKLDFLRDLDIRELIQEYC